MHIFSDSSNDLRNKIEINDEKKIIALSEILNSWKIAILTTDEKIKIYTFSKDFESPVTEAIVNDSFKYSYWKYNLLNISNFEFMATN